MVSIIVQLIYVISRVLTFLVVIEVILSYILSPFHPIRQVVNRIIGPMLAPIRKIVPTAGMIDFSPLILIVLIQVLEIVLVNILV